MDPSCYLCFVFVFQSYCHVVTCWERADLLADLYVIMFLCFCHFPIWCPGLGAVLDCINSWSLPSLLLLCLLLITKLRNRNLC